MNLTDTGTVRELFARHGLSFTKSLGQNFLVSERVLSRIAGESRVEGFGVLEIGPGIGTLTRELAARAVRVCAVEIDMSFQPVHSETLAGFNNVSFIYGDILKQDILKLTDRELAGLPLAVCANLPYCITTPVLEKLWKTGCFQHITVMVQKEAARRICAAPGTPEYGTLAAKLSLDFETDMLFGVPTGCFYPAPKVDSAVVRLRRRELPFLPAPSRAQYAQVVNAAFAQRRKKLPGAICAVFGGVIGKDAVRELLFRCGIDPDRRGETLSACEFAVLSAEIGAVLCEL